VSRKVPLILVTIGVLLALYPAAKLATAQAHPSPLFVQTAQNIDYMHGVMTLYGVPAQTMSFTDRPNREVGNLPTNALVAKWTRDREPNGLAANPPNAAATLFEPSDGAKTSIVELTNPRLDGNKSSYNVKVLQGIGPAQPAEGVPSIDNFG
jgi:hypothetical protein